MKGLQQMFGNGVFKNRGKRQTGIETDTRLSPFSVVTLRVQYANFYSTSVRAASGRITEQEMF